MTPIRNLQTMLQITADGVFGAETENAVMLFQRQNGLAANGRVDFQTWNAIVSAYLQRDDSLPIRENEENAHLYPLKAMLCALHAVFPDCPEIPICQRHDAESVNAVRYLQRLCALKETGTVGAAEKKHLIMLHELIHADGTGRI